MSLPSATTALPSSTLGALGSAFTPLGGSALNFNPAAVYAAVQQAQQQQADKQDISTAASASALAATIAASAGPTSQPAPPSLTASLGAPDPKKRVTRKTTKDTVDGATIPALPTVLDSGAATPSSVTSVTSVAETAEPVRKRVRKGEKHVSRTFQSYMDIAIHYGITSERQAEWKAAGKTAEECSDIRNSCAALGFRLKWKVDKNGHHTLREATRHITSLKLGKRMRDQMDKENTACDTLTNLPMLPTTQSEVKSTGTPIVKEAESYVRKELAGNDAVSECAQLEMCCMRQQNSF